MTVVDFQPFGSLPEEELRYFEAKIGHTLPEDYRKWLAATNGAEAPYLVSEKEFDLYTFEESLWGIHPEHPIDDLPTRNLWISHSVTKDYLAITSYIGGFVLLALNGPRRGKIYMLTELQMGFEPPADSPYATPAEYYCAETLYPAADSFTEFYESLIPAPEDT